MGVRSLLKLLIFFSNDDPYYGSFTVLFFMAPFITSVVFTISAMILSQSLRLNKLLQCVYHLPGLQLIRQFQFLRELKTCLADFNLADKMSKNVVSWIDTCENLDVDKEWSWQMIDECIQDDLESDTLALDGYDKEFLKTLFVREHGDYFSDVASSTLKKLAINEKKRTTANLGNLQARIQEFKMCEAYLGRIFYKFD